MNQWCGIGRLTKDPELSYTSGTNTAIATFILAVDRPTKEKQADFIRVKVIGKQGENVNKYLCKGSEAGVEGYIETGSYDGKNGRVYYTNVVANRVTFIGGKPENKASGGNEVSEKNEEKHEEVEEQEGIEDFEYIDEDVPF